MPVVLRVAFASSRTRRIRSMSSNWGSQCKMSVGATSVEHGAIRRVPETDIRLVIGSKAFTAAGGKAKSNKMSYRARFFKSGRLGFRWGSGSAAGDLIPKSGSFDDQRR